MEDRHPPEVGFFSPLCLRIFQVGEPSLCIPVDLDLFARTSCVNERPSIRVEIPPSEREIAEAGADAEGVAVIPEPRVCHRSSLGFFLLFVAPQRRAMILC